jgi:hypothetical protein
MELSGQHHTPAALPPGEERQYPLNVVGWAPIASLKYLELRKISHLPSHYTNYIIPSPQKLSYRSS